MPFFYAFNLNLSLKHSLDRLRLASARQASRSHLIPTILEQAIRLTGS